MSSEDDVPRRRLPNVKSLLQCLEESSANVKLGVLVCRAANSISRQLRDEQSYLANESWHNLQVELVAFALHGLKGGTTYMTPTGHGQTSVSGSKKYGLVTVSLT